MWTQQMLLCIMCAFQYDSRQIPAQKQGNAFGYAVGAGLFKGQHIARHKRPCGPFLDQDIIGGAQLPQIFQGSCGSSRTGRQRMQGSFMAMNCP